jgi:hypothetical protein
MKHYFSSTYPAQASLDRDQPLRFLSCETGQPMVYMFRMSRAIRRNTSATSLAALWRDASHFGRFRFCGHSSRLGHTRGRFHEVTEDLYTRGGR